MRKINKGNMLGIFAAASLVTSCGSKSSSSPAEDPPAAAAPAPATSTATSTGTSTGTKTTTTKPKFVPQNVPASIAPTVPASVGKKKASLNLLETKSHGYGELNYQFETMVADIAETTLYLMLGDAGYNDAMASCNNVLPCTAKNLKVKVTQEIANTVKSLTDSSFEEEQVTLEDGAVGDFKVGDDVTIDSLNIRENVRYGTQTYKKCFKFGGQEKDDAGKVETNWTSEICFNEAKTKVYVHDLESGKLPDISDATKKVNYDSKYSATFNLDNGVFQSKTSMAYGKSKFANDLLVDSRSESELTALKAAMTEADRAAFKDKEDIFVVANIAGDEPGSGGPYSVKLEGFINDDGGVIKAAYTLATISITGATFSGSVDTDTYYLMIPPGPTDAQVKEAAFDLAIGSLYTDTTEGALDFTKDELDYWGPPTLPANVKLYKVSTDENGAQTFTDSGVKVNTIATTTDLDTDWFQEKFDSKGTLLGTCYTEVDGGTPECSGETLTEDLKKIPDGGIKVPGALKVSFDSAFTAASLTGHDFVVLTGSKVVDSTVTPAQPSSFSDDLLVLGTFKGKPTALQSDGVVNDYRIVVPPGLVKSDFDGAKLYKISYDSSTGVPSFVQLTTHTVTVTEQN